MGSLVGKEGWGRERCRNRMWWCVLERKNILMELDIPRDKYIMRGEIVELKCLLARGKTKEYATGGTRAEFIPMRLCGGSKTKTSKDLE